MLSVIDNEVRRILSESGDQLAAKTGTVLFEQGKPSTGIYLIVRGEVVTTLGENGGEQLAPRTATRGSLLGVPATINGTTYSISAVVSEDAELIHIPRQRLVELMRSVPSVSFAIIDILSTEVRTMREAMKAPRKYVH